MLKRTALSGQLSRTSTHPNSPADLGYERYSFDRSSSVVESLITSPSSRIRPKSSLYRRTSSFGGAPLLIKQVAEISQEEEPSNIRWMILFLSCMLLFGNYYAYDNPAALNKPLQEWLKHDYDTYQYEINLLYSVYSFPNMLLPLIGGQLLDRLDPRKVLLIFSAFVCIGQTIFAYGVTIKQFPVMLFGRILFGIGGESISVIQASITTDWFKNKELAFALGLSLYLHVNFDHTDLCIARFGSVVNAVFSPRIEKWLNVPAAVWTGSITCYMSFLSAILLVLIMSTHKTKSTHNGGEDTVTSSPLLTSRRNSIDTNRITVNNSVWDFVALRNFPFSFWLVCIICILLYGTVVPFNNIASDFLMSKWFPNDTEKAGLIMSIPDTISAFLVPFCGVFVDRYGRRPALLALCALVIASVHATLGLSMINPVIPLFFLGISYSIYGAAIWPSVATIIQHHEEDLQRKSGEDEPPRLLGTAYGVSTSALNTALTIMPLISAQIRVLSTDYTFVEFFFVFLALMGFTASIILWIVDIKNDKILQKPEYEPAHTADIDSSIDFPEIQNIPDTRRTSNLKYVLSGYEQQGSEDSKRMYADPQEFD